MLREYVANEDVRAIIRQELVYVLSAWLYSRYPSQADPVWDDPQAWVQPSRKPVGSPDWDAGQVYPALSPLEP
jgi:hypothetical protein